MASSVLFKIFVALAIGLAVIQIQDPQLFSTLGQNEIDFRRLSVDVLDISFRSFIDEARLEHPTHQRITSDHFWHLKLGLIIFHPPILKALIAIFIGIIYLCSQEEPARNLTPRELSLAFMTINASLARQTHPIADVDAIVQQIINECLEHHPFLSEGHIHMLDTLITVSVWISVWNFNGNNTAFFLGLENQGEDINREA